MVFLKVSEMEEKLICLLRKDIMKDGDNYTIHYILPKDDDFVKFWMSDKFKGKHRPGYVKTKPYEDGDVSMTSGNKILFGLQILYKYNINLELHSEHDQLWAGGKDMSQEEMCKLMSEEDIKRMDELDWFDDEDSWSHWT
jgi:hypothetical protein